MLAGTKMLADVNTILDQAKTIRFSIILKVMGGGDGGIRIGVCRRYEEARDSFAQVSCLAEEKFRVSGVYMERYIPDARHVEMQIFGDGRCNSAIIRDRDCSLPLHNQKATEDTPAPILADSICEEMYKVARRLLQSVRYRLTGTVKLIYDPHTRQAFFPKVSIRLQIEYPVTGIVHGVNLVQSMSRLACNGFKFDYVIDPMWLSHGPQPHDRVAEARIYAEDPAKNSFPCDGFIDSIYLYQYK